MLLFEHIIVVRRVIVIFTCSSKLWTSSPGNRTEARAPRLAEDMPHPDLRRSRIQPRSVQPRCRRRSHRCSPKPPLTGCLIAVEIVSADSITTDIRDKRAEYAAAGIPRYWIVRMTDKDGPAISVERLLLTSDGEYAREGLAIRGRDFHAIDTISPFPLKLTWEALDEGL